jgi:D-serine deaminase-like pyridoxal phosphate-dependent protein
MYQPQPGDPLVALDTPVMIIDIQLMEENIAWLMVRS